MGLFCHCGEIYHSPQKGTPSLHHLAGMLKLPNERQQLTFPAGLASFHSEIRVCKCVKFLGGGGLRTIFSVSIRIPQKAITLLGPSVLWEATGTPRLPQRCKLVANALPHLSESAWPKSRKSSRCSTHRADALSIAAHLQRP